LAFVAASPKSYFNVELDDHWTMFKSEFAKTYENEHHETMRRLIWEDNLKMIQKHNLDYDMGRKTYSLGMNEFGDWTHEEFVARYFGLNLNVTRSTVGAKFMSPLNVESLPDEVDWRTNGYVTPVKNQGHCGSCWAFSTTGSVEGQYYRKNKKLVSLSEQQLVDCSRSFHNMGCSGGLMDNAFEYLEKFGLEQESDYGYIAQDAHCHYDAKKIVTKIHGYTDVDHGSEVQLQQALATVGPVSVAIDAGQHSFQFYRHGVYNEMACSSTRLNHGVLAVGYGTEDGVDFFLVKNSWGTVWGQSGYIKMSRGKNNQCGIASMASYPNL
jgi:cathepsin L